MLVDLLALMFGLGSWIGVNGVYVQLPLIVNTAPEGWSLPAHMVMLVQIANLGPILYTLYLKYVPCNLQCNQDSVEHQLIKILVD